MAFGWLCVVETKSPKMSSVAIYLACVASRPTMILQMYGKRDSQLNLFHMKINSHRHQRISIQVTIFAQLALRIELNIYGTCYVTGLNPLETCVKWMIYSSWARFASLCWITRPRETFFVRHSDMTVNGGKSLKSVKVIYDQLSSLSKIRKARRTISCTFHRPHQSRDV